MTLSSSRSILAYLFFVRVSVLDVNNIGLSFCSSIVFSFFMDVSYSMVIGILGLKYCRM